VNVVGIEIGDADKKALRDLAGTRNALQHWGLTESAPAVEAGAAKVLDFLIRFLDDELLKELDDDQVADIDKDMLHVRQGLNGIKAYVESRMDRLRGELKGLEDRTVACPDCTQFALVFDREVTECHFCPRLWDPEVLAEEYALEILDYSMRELMGGGAALAVDCPNCGTRTLVMNAYTAADPEQPVDICFNCAEVFDRLESCTRCGQHYVPDEDETICGDCWSELIASD
jgi:DNA-directed RNA polymerase subunit RPC12/RpoP